MIKLGRYALKVIHLENFLACLLYKKQVSIIFSSIYVELMIW